MPVEVTPQKIQPSKRGSLGVHRLQAAVPVEKHARTVPHRGRPVSRESDLVCRVLHTPGGMRRLSATLTFALAFAVCASPAAAQSFRVSGSGGSPNVAIDAAGNILVAYKVDTYGPTDAVELCAVPPRRRTCAFRTRVAFPGEGYNINPVGLVVSTDGTVVVTTGRADSNGGSVYAATSSDGGRSFRAAASGSPTARPGPRC